MAQARIVGHSCGMTDAQLTPDQIDAAQLADWRFLNNALHTRFLTGDFVTGLRLVNAIGEAAEAAGHHPDLDVRYPHVNVKVWTHDVSGLTEQDVLMARRISEIAAGLGIAAEPAAVSAVGTVLEAGDSEGS